MYYQLWIVWAGISCTINYGLFGLEFHVLSIIDCLGWNFMYYQLWIVWTGISCTINYGLFGLEFHVLSIMDDITFYYVFAL